MQVAVARETTPGERRVALIPDVLPKLGALGVQALVEKGAGSLALFSDSAYEQKGAELVEDAREAYARAEVVCKVQPPSLAEVQLLAEGSAVVSFLQPGTDLELIALLRDRRISAFSLDLLPRISRAQSMDALSSQATVSGYRAALIAADRLPRFFPLFMTAAGTVPPAKVLVLGAGVAGLQAIATARRLGAVVRAYDVRPAARDEVKSLGAAFVELELETQEGQGGYAKEQSEEFLRRQREAIGKEVAAADVVITTAAIPGRKAPVLVTGEMVERMSPGSLVVDLAAESGGNCELSVPGESVAVGAATVVGVRNLPSSMPMHASFLYSRNVAEFVGLLARDGTFAPDFTDEIIAGTCVTHDGEIRHAPTRELVEGGQP
ncbi:MAG: Re/Si-specific NAD(P)(+) transhydrogenase subunit alpha [Acidimicrobiales bacterium]